MSVPDKILISNDSALGSKYGPSKPNIDAAVQRLIAGDGTRGLTTIYIAIDDAVAMKVVGGTAVSSTTDQAANKAAVDAVFQHFAPDYIVLLGGPDVIPHQDLMNPVYSPPDDPDQFVPSDLPYACPNGYSTDPKDFVGATRTVTRIPDLNNSSDAGYLVTLLDFAARAAAGNAVAYGQYLGVTAQQWSGSSQLSLAAIFGNSTQMQQVPPSGYNWTNAQLQVLSHFFNCHGAPNDHRFYGQLGQSYPVAHDASYIASRLHQGTVVAAECCYGAQLYDPAANNGQMGIANTYMQQGAYGFFGSTTVAYGPANSNANADLICQLFMQELVRGGSLGRACLTARQSFVQSGASVSPTDLKTLAQFIALGDASVQCIAPPSTATETQAKYGLKGVLGEGDARLRKERRMSLEENGRFLQQSKAAVDVRSRREPEGAIVPQLQELAEKAGYRQPRTLTFDVGRPERAAMTKLAVPEVSRFHVIIDTITTTAPRGVSTRILEVQEIEGRIVNVRELFSR